MSFELEEESAPQPTVLGAVARHRRLVEATVLLFVVAALLAANYFPKQATATASIVVEDPHLAAPYGGGQASPNYVADQIAILRLPVVADAAAKAMAHDLPGSHLTTDDFLSHTSISSGPAGDNGNQSSLIKISFRSRNPRVAQAGANAVVEGYRQVLQQSAATSLADTLSRIKTQISQLDSVIASSPDTNPQSAPRVLREQLLARQSELLVNNASTPDGIIAESPAALPGIHRGGEAARLGLLALFVGLLVAAALSYVLALRRRRFDSRLDPELVLGVPLVAEIPHFASEKLPTAMPAVDRPDSATAESFRAAAAALAFRQARLGAMNFAVTAAAAGDGTSTVVANLAATVAAEGRKVLIIDGDFATTAVTTLIESAGVLSGILPLDLGGRTVGVSVIDLHGELGAQVCVLSGEETRSAIGDLSRPTMARDFLNMARRYFDLVLVDVPSVRQVAYAANLLAETDATVIVVPHDGNVARVDELTERLRFLEIELDGYIYNRAPSRREAPPPVAREGQTRRAPLSRSLPLATGGAAPEAPYRPPADSGEPVADVRDVRADAGVHDGELHEADLRDADVRTVEEAAVDVHGVPNGDSASSGSEARYW